MKTLFDYLSTGVQEKLVAYSQEKGVPLGQIKVRESYEGSKQLYSINPLGATTTKQYQKINGTEYSWPKRKDYIGRRVDMQLRHNFEAGIIA